MSSKTLRTLFALLVVLTPIALTGCNEVSTPSNVTPGPSPTTNYPGGPDGKTPVPRK